MFGRIKKFFYFPVAAYFRFFASVRLRMWSPRVIVVTGSSGKTTLLHLIESQLGTEAKFSHCANSSFGIPFDILGIRRKELTLIEWPLLILLPIVNLFKELPKQKIYVVEADCDRPNEGNFLSSLLKPEVTIWTNVSRTHGMNFDALVKKGAFKSVEGAISHEFGFFAERTKNLVIFNKGDRFQNKEMKRANAEKTGISPNKSIGKYEVNLNQTKFNLDGSNYNFNCLMPKETAINILMCLRLVDYLGIKREPNFTNFSLPPGRSNTFKGIKGTTIIDSSYNANLDSMRAILGMFEAIKVKPKWIVLGDMLEQGTSEKEEHQKLARVIAKLGFERMILVGPRLGKYTLPILKATVRKNIKVAHFMEPKEALIYLKNTINGGEVILFKGARFLEGIIEGILKNKKDIRLLARREKIWQIRRKKWGL